MNVEEENTCENQQKSDNQCIPKQKTSYICNRKIMIKLNDRQ